MSETGKAFAISAFGKPYLHLNGSKGAARPLMNARYHRSVRAGTSGGFSSALTAGDPPNHAH